MMAKAKTQTRDHMAELLSELHRRGAVVDGKPISVEHVVPFVRGMYLEIDKLNAAIEVLLRKK